MLSVAFTEELCEKPGGAVRTELKLGGYADDVGREELHIQAFEDLQLPPEPHRQLVLEIGGRGDLLSTAVSVLCHKAAGSISGQIRHTKVAIFYAHSPSCTCLMRRA